jgi:regulator of RNase E activity RraA
MTDATGTTDAAETADAADSTGSSPFADIPTTTLAVLLGRGQVMDIGIRPLWSPVPRVAGPAFTVRCPPGDNLMLHAAIHRAAPGSVIVVESGDLDYALAGGNVCAVARRRGVAAFVADGLIRDLGEVRELGFPVFARGVIPVPGAKRAVRPLNGPVR